MKDTTTNNHSASGRAHVISIVKKIGNTVFNILLITDPFLWSGLQAGYEHLKSWVHSTRPQDALDELMA